MKLLYINLITAMIITMIIPIKTLSQCDNGVSTDPANSTNNELPDDTTSAPPYAQDTRYLNGLDWWTPTSYALDSMWFNPTQPYGTMTNIQSSLVSSYYTYLVKNSSTGVAAQEMNPTNGW